MFVCHCRAVTDGVVRRVVAEGAADPEAVARYCGAGTGCGGCRPLVAALIAQWSEWHDHGAGETITPVVLSFQDHAA